MYFEEKDLVTATKRTTSLRRAPAIATIVTAEEISTMGARNLLDILKMVPGFGISLNEFGAPMVEVRGIRTALNEKILLMIDGHSLNKNFTASGLFAEIEVPVENIKQVEVVRGPGSALYGSNAFVATINIITRDAEEIDGLEVKAGGGSFDTYKANVVGGTTIGDKFSVTASFDQYKTNGPKLRVESDYLSTNPPLFPVPTAPFSGAPGAPDLSMRQTDAFLKIGYGDFSFRGQFVSRRKGAYIGYNYTLTDGSHNDVDNYWGELAYHLHFNDAMSLTTKLRYDFFEQYGVIKIYPAGFFGTFPDGAYGKPLVKDRTIGVEQQFDWEPFKNNHLIIGASFEALRQYDVRHLTTYDPNTGAFLGGLQQSSNWNKDVTRETWATYIQDEWRLLDTLNLTAGVRYDHYSDFGDTTNPRVGLVWSFMENAELKLLFGQAFRAPNFIELYSINNPLLLGSPTLKPERIRTYEAGLSYRFNRFLAADLNYFYSTIHDQIVWDSSLTPAFYTNLGKTETQGVEFGLNGSVGPEFHWKATYVFQDPRDALTDRQLPYVPSHRGTASVNYAPFKYLNLHSDLLWTGPRPRPAGDSRPEMPAYATVDLSITLRNFFESLEIQTTIRNLLDQRFKDPDTSGGQQKVPGDFPREGISAFVTASYKF